ncbi:acyl-CoA N-acyltransferase, partial [Ramicandelaber brevisporus]
SEDSTSPQVEEIIYGRYRLRTWFDSPYPDDARAAERLFICERCLKYMKLANTYAVHIAPHPLSSSASECQRDSHPPGKLVYTHSNTIAVYKVDGRKEKLFCQNLSLLGKGFLEHKTLFYDLDSFVFYVLVEHSSAPLSSFSSSSSSSAISSTLHNTFNIDYDALPHYRVLGYFSKEKHSVEGHNLSCIVVLPPFRRGGLGRMLIELSYRISHLSGQIGTPERPLSDLGLWTYSKFWKTTVARVL